MIFLQHKQILHMTKYLILVLISIILFSGCASKRYAKKGLEFEQVGYYEKAAEMYYMSLVKNYNNVDAAIGLKKNGQLTLNKMLEQFLDYYRTDLIKDAVYKYIECEEYYTKAKDVGIEFNFPKSYIEYFTEVKNIYLEEIYNEAYLLLEDESFEKAELKFNEILLIDPSYGDVSELKKTAHYEPIYRKGKNYLNQQKYRLAYYSFDKILKDLHTYKNSQELLETALSNAIITIAFIDFTNISRYPNIEKQLQSNVEKQLSEVNSPFIKIVDRDNNERITSEQLLSLQGQVDEVISSKAGKMLGVKSLLTGQLQEYTIYNGSLKKSEKKGYIKEIKTEVKNGEKVEKTVYHKVNYYEYNQSKSITCKFQFKLISTETAEVLVSDIITVTADDEIHYAKFDGNNKNLVKGYWESSKKKSSKDEVDDNYSDNKKLQRLLNGRSNIKSIDKLKIEISNYIGTKTATKVEKYDPEK